MNEEFGKMPLENRQLESTAVSTSAPITASPPKSPPWITLIFSAPGSSAKPMQNEEVSPLNSVPPLFAE